MNHLPLTQGTKAGEGTGSQTPATRVSPTFSTPRIPILPGVAKEKSRSTAKTAQSTLMLGGRQRSRCSGSKVDLRWLKWVTLEALGFIEGLLPQAARQEEKLEQTHLQRGVVCLPASAMSPRPAGPTHKGTWQPGPCSSGLLLAGRRPLSPTRTRRGNSPSSRSGCQDSAASTRGAAGHSSARAGASRGCRQQSCCRRWWMESGHLADKLSALSAGHGHNGQSRGIRSITENSFEGASVPEQCFGSEVPQGSSPDVVLWNIFIES